MPDVRKIMVAEDEDAPANGVVVQTPGPLPNWKVVVVPGFFQAVVRAVRTYLQAVVGLLGGSMTGVLPAPVPVGDFWAALMFAAGAALLPAMVSLLWNLSELLGQWDKTRPELRG